MLQVRVRMGEEQGDSEEVSELWFVQMDEPAHTEPLPPLRTQMVFASWYEAL